MSENLFETWERRIETEIKEQCPRGIDCRLGRVTLSGLEDSNIPEECDSMAAWICSEECGLDISLFQSAIQVAGKAMQGEGLILDFSD